MSKIVSGIGRAVGSVLKGIGNAVKAIVKSPIGKIALAAAATYFTAGAGLSAVTAGEGAAAAATGAATAADAAALAEVGMGTVEVGGALGANTAGLISGAAGSALPAGIDAATGGVMDSQIAAAAPEAMASPASMVSPSTLAPSFENPAAWQAADAGMSGSAPYASGARGLIQQYVSPGLNAVGDALSPTADFMSKNKLWGPAAYLGGGLIQGIGAAGMKKAEWDRQDQARQRAYQNWSVGNLVLR